MGLATCARILHCTAVIGSTCRYFKSRLDILYTFIPQIIFLSCIFIYLCIEIVAKWIYYYSGVSGGDNT